MVVLTIVFPKADGANVETASLSKRAATTTWTKMRSIFCQLIDILVLHFARMALVSNVRNWVVGGHSAR
jgi:hypothetical protein